MRHAPLLEEVTDQLPVALFPTFQIPHMKQSAPAASPPFAAGLSAGGEHKTGSASSAASSSMPSGPPSLASFRSSLSGASLASFAAPMLPYASLPAPSAPLLSRGRGHSSAHLSLVALDPESSVLDKSVLHRLKLQMLKGQAKPAQVKSRSMETVTPAHAAATKTSRKRRNHRAGDKPELAPLDADHKKQKTHSLVPKQSLLTLEKQLSREPAPASAEDLELAAFAIARHLVEFAADFDGELQPDSEDEEEFAAMEAGAGAASPKHRAMVEVPASMPLEWISPMRSLSEFRMASGVALDGGGDFHSASSSASSTPAFDPAGAGLEMERRDSAITMSAQEPEQAEAPATQVFHPASPMLLEELHLPDPDVSAEMASASSGLGLGFDLSPLLTSSSAYAALSSMMSLSPLGSPKASPSLLAHLASPHERAAQLVGLGGFSLDAPAAMLADTTTSSGQRVALMQHSQMAW